VQSDPFFRSKNDERHVWRICRVMIAVTDNYWSSHFWVACWNAAECNPTFSPRVHRRTCLSVWCRRTILVLCIVCKNVLVSSSLWSPRKRRHGPCMYPLSRE